VPAIWGCDGDVAWAEGEPMMPCGPQGVGKTALSEQLALRRVGVRDGDLLGMPVEVSAGRALYIAADRPRQAARSFRRMVTEADREALRTGLVVWRGPLPFDLGRCQRGDLLEFVSNWSEVSDVYIDALKDVAVKLTDDEVGSRVNAEFQQLIAHDIQLVADHHQRKASADNKKPRTLADVYGSTWLTTGMGSVLLLWGEAGDPIVEVSHLKQPSGEVGPLQILHDHDRGEIGLYEPRVLYTMAREALGDGLTVHSAAMQLYETSDPNRNEKQKARGKLQRLVKRGKLTEVPGSDPTAYRVKQ
jgi:replicative DNA helicase